MYRTVKHSNNNNNNNKNNVYKGSPRHESDIQWGPVDREKKLRTTVL